MKALSIQQPWAWLIANGYKDIENRDWPTKGRGWFLIHAGKKIDTDAIDWIRQAFPEIPLPDSFDVGGIVGMARIVDVVTASDSPWFFGRYGFVINHARPMQLIPCKGQLGFFVPPVEGIDLPEQRAGA